MVPSHDHSGSSRFAAAAAALAAFVGLLAAGCGGPTFTRPQLQRVDRTFEYAHDIELFQVTNGMKVAVVPERNTNLVRVDLRFLVGAAEDPPGKEGLAHLVEHLMFEVRLGDEGPTLEEELSRVAFSYNAYTSFDETHYVSVALQDRLGELLAVEQARMSAGCDAISDEAFERERAIVVQEILERSSPLSDAIQPALAAAFGPEHRFGRSIGGTPAGMRALTRDDVCDFIDRYYAPDRAVLVVSGNLTAPEVRPRIGQLFGPIERQAGAPRAALPAFAGDGSSSRHEVAVREPTALLLFERPTFGHPAGLLHQMVLQLLHRRLAELEAEHDFITGISSGVLGSQRSGLTVFAISVADAAKLDRAVELFFEARGKMLEDVSALHVRAMFGALRAELVRAHEPLGERAIRIADYLTYTDHYWLMLEEMSWLSRFNGTSLGQYGAKTFLRDDAHIAHLLPGKRAAQRVQVELGDGRARDFDIELHTVPVDPELALRPADLRVQPVPVQVSRHRLANGVEVLLVPGLEHPYVDIRVVFRGGDSLDPADRPGLAYLAAILLEKDLPDQIYREDSLIIREIESWGVEPSATTTGSASIFRIAGLSIHADGLIWELHWLLQSGTYDKKALTRLAERFARLAGQSDRDGAELRARHALGVALYGANHPYARRWTPDRLFQGLKVSDLAAFHRRYQHLGGATVVVTGRFDEAQMLAWVNRYFGEARAPKTPVEPVPIPAATPRTAPVHLAVPDPDRVQPLAVIAYRLDNGFRQWHAERLILEQVLNGRLQRLRARMGATYGVSVGYDLDEGPGSLRISTALSPERAADAFRELRELIEGLRRDGIGPEEFIRARAHVLERQLARAVDSDSVGDVLQFAVVHGVELDYWETLAGAVAAVTLPDMAPVLDDLAPAREVVLLQGEQRLIEAMYRAAGIRAIHSVGDKTAAAQGAR